ncbi:MAG: hypothetical protein Ct9H300mP7_3390 [Verrucomicrobiota bacterium]|nr:MAG: hypothetical protein Ct9H300mP7_3390 [Verrucomicrobiota bacterium]
MTKPAANELSPGRSIIVTAGSDSEKRLIAGLDDFRDLFPASLCYPRIVPVDEVVTIALYHREDEPLQRLMLDEAGKTELNRLWDELIYVSKEPFKLVVSHEQNAAFATQDRPGMVVAFAPMRDPIRKQANAFRKRLEADEPKHLYEVLQFADRAWRRPLTGEEQGGLRMLYRVSRAGNSHEKAIQLTIARVLTSPAFLYRREQPGGGAKPEVVSSYEQAARFIFFLWSSLPDKELRQVSEEGELANEKTLLAQTRRMLRDSRTRRMAEQFACQWLHISGFDQNNDKNVKLYPEFPELRGDMYEESVLFFEDMFRNNGSVIDLLDADHAFLNERLARITALTA